MTDQQQNSDDIIDSFDMSDTSNLFNQASLNQASLNKASFNEASLSKSELPAFYQHLDHSHINI